MNEIDKSETQRRIAVMQGFLDGKILQIRDRLGSEPWRDYAENLEPEWDWSSCDYRIKPLEFPKLPEGMEWHNPAGLTPEQVGGDFRLLTTAELDGESDPHIWYWSNNFRKWYQYGTAPNYYGKRIPSDTSRVPISTPFPEPPKPKARVPLEMKDLPMVFWVRGNFEQWLCTGRDKENKKIHFKGEWKSLVICHVEGWEMSVDPNDDDSWTVMEKESES